MSEPVLLHSASSKQTIESGLGTLSLSDLHDEPSPDHAESECAPEEADLPEETEDERIERMQQQLAIRRGLDQQTQILYEQYAQEQHPKDVEKQKELVSELQEQNFLRYMSEVYEYQVVHQQQQIEQLYSERSSPNECGDGEPGDSQPNYPLPLIPAVIWTRKDLSEFKQEILSTQKECCIKIGSLATATVRVPTHKDGSAIFWEFATDSYDLGFGLYFEWDLEPSNSISVTISESSEDEDEGEDETNGPSGHTPPHDSAYPPQGPDVERGRSNSVPRHPTDELIPIYRRDCHKEVYCGSHHYPGVGVYVFKFDNSFSLWRSKWLYYRIYYTQ